MSLIDSYLELDFDVKPDGESDALYATNTDIKLFNLGLITLFSEDKL